MERHKIQCTAERKLFPPGKEDELGFMVCAYRAQDMCELPPGATSDRFVAKGPLLPYSPASKIILYGEKWEVGSDGTPTLVCSGYDESMPNSAQAVTAFLTTLDGCEISDAARIMNNADGDNPIGAIAGDLAIIRKSIKNKGTAERIMRACKLRRMRRDEFFYVLPFLPKNSRAQVAADIALSAEGLSDIKKDPFGFVIDGIMPYRMGKAIAKANGIPINGVRGVQAAIIDVLKQSEGQSAGYAYDEQTVGNTFTEKKELMAKAANVVGISKDSPFISDALTGLLEAGRCICTQDKYVYRKETCDAEYGIATEVVRLMSSEISSRDYKLDIYALENKKQMRLAPEQRAAVKVALANPVTLLIGGPGTGKTTIEQFIIEVFRMYHDDGVLLVAPTGKAARRMSESTGEPACTVHKALGVSAGTEVLVSDAVLDAGLVMIDEASMLDSQVAYALLKAIKQGAQVVIVGDTNQLPSVGAGNVLYELIHSGTVPVAALERVYRQKAGSTIAINCARIKRGSPDMDEESVLTFLEFSETFQFMEIASQEEAARKVLEIYQNEMARGLRTEDICLLSPYRQSTPTGVNQLNKELQLLLLNPDAPSLAYGKKTFYLGDKVMLMANREDVANGDVGYIVSIESGKRFNVDFGDGRVIRYQKSDLRDFDLAYGISIHKSQGAEFETCIIVVMDEHKNMLNRNIIYTAVSRAKKNVFIVGTRSALCSAIQTEEVTKRQSRLGEIISSLVRTA